MRMRTKLFEAIFLAATFLSQPLQQEQGWREVARNKLLKEEWTLARAPASYIVFDLPQKTISLKARGMTLREWKVKSFRSWGNPVALEIIILEKKSALFAPKRKKIKPRANQAGAPFELNVLELKDMPSAFVLSMSGGLSIYVRSASENFSSRLIGLVRSLKWYTWLPLKNLWFRLKKRRFASLDFKLSSQDEAKAFYWAIGEGFKGLIYP